MEHIYGIPGTSIKKLNHDKQITLQYLEAQKVKIMHEIENGKTGLEGERKVGDVLNKFTIENPGYDVIHDVSFHGQNIDHIIIYEDRMIIIIETKTLQRPPFGHLKDKIIHQVHGQWEYLKQKLGVTYVKSIICFSKSGSAVDIKEHGIDLVDIDSLAETIRSYVKKQVEHGYAHDKTGLLNDILALKNQQ